jgi:hypothetical protein
LVISAIPRIPYFFVACEGSKCWYTNYFTSSPQSTIARKSRATEAPDAPKRRNSPKKSGYRSAGRAAEHNSPKKSGYRSAGRAAEHNSPKKSGYRSAGCAAERNSPRKSGYCFERSFPLHPLPIASSSIRPASPDPAESPYRLRSSRPYRRKCTDSKGLALSKWGQMYGKRPKCTFRNAA